MNRRKLLVAAVAALVFAQVSSFAKSAKRGIVKDFSGIDAISVADERRPRTTEKVREAITQ